MTERSRADDPTDQDFSVTPDGRWWFLECNPAGQWGWIAEETGLPIAETIADELVRAA